MESESEQGTVIKRCDCCTAKLDDSGIWLRTVKRKLDERDDHDALFIPGLSDRDVARIDIGNECAALREMVKSQQEMIEDLSIELDEERNAASSAANEAMSMILRLQSEKAEVQMEARQFKRFSEERMAHDQDEIMMLEDCLYKREHSIEALTCEVHAYKHRMLSYGLTESEANGGLIRNDNNDGFEFPDYNYPPLKCNLIEHRTDQELNDETIDIQKVTIGNSPRRLSYDNQEGLVSDTKKVDSVPESGDDMSDRKYIVDSFHNLASDDNDPKVNRVAYDDFKGTDIGGSEVKKLYARVHVLEADRESMKQALMSMRTDKAQLVLLKEIAQYLYKDMSSPSNMPVKKPSIFQKFSFFVLFKWLTSFLLLRSTHRSKYTFGMSASNAGLRMLVNKGPHVGKWRCLSRTRFLKY